MSSGKIGMSMRYKDLLSGIIHCKKGVMSSYNEIFKFSGSEKGKFRLKVIEHFKSFGLLSRISAYGVPKSTIYKWLKTYKDSGKELTSLIPKSSSPINKRKMKVGLEVVSFIRKLRKEHCRLGKTKIKSFLDAFCEEKNYKKLSVSTIGKVIKRYYMVSSNNYRIYHNPNSKWAKRKLSYKGRVKKSPKVKEPGYIQVDTIHRFINGMKFYIFNGLDLYTKFQFSYAYRSPSSKNGVDFLKKFIKVFPLKRANRSLNEEFIQKNIYEINEIDIFNINMMEHLIWFNALRPHHSLNNLSPIQLISHMYGTYTTN